MESNIAGLREATEAIESAYEFSLAYAAQGHTPAPGDANDTRIREHLARAAGAVRSLATPSQPPQPDLPAAFAALLAEDARRSLAALDFVLAEPAISSPMADSLNASLHLRALLADLFLLSECHVHAASSRPLPESA